MLLRLTNELSTAQNLLENQGVSNFHIILINKVENWTLSSKLLLFIMCRSGRYAQLCIFLMNLCYSTLFLYFTINDLCMR